MKQVRGQCSCRAVEYKFSTESLIAYQCHCSMCRKATGSAFATIVMAPEEWFRWVRGEEAISTHAKGNGYRVNFCSHCGSPVPNKFRDYPLLSIPAGSIEGTPEIKVAAQLFLGSRATWDHDTLEGRQFDEAPSRDEMFKLLGIHGTP